MTVHFFHSRRLALPLMVSLFALLLMLGFSGPGLTPIFAQEPATIAVRGQVINGTDGGAVPANHPISLHVIDPLAGRVGTYDATTDGDGAFSFADVEPVDGGSYVLVMDYEDMRYSELVEAGDLDGGVELTVYEITRDISVISVQRQAMIIADINETGREIQALEVLSVRNTSDRTLLPELTNITNPADINFLRFSLPLDATELSVQSTLPGGDTIPMGTGFALTAPVMPGEHEITYAYRFPYQGDSVTFSQRLIQGAERFQVLAPVALSQIQVSPLESRPSIDVGGTPYLVWETTQIPARQGLVLQFSQLPQPGLATRLVNQTLRADLWLVVIPAALALALAALLVWAWFRAPRLVAAVVPFAGPEQVQRQALVRAVALLDEGYEAGQVPHDEYSQRREDLLARLRQTSGPSDSGEPNP